MDAKKNGQLSAYPLETEDGYDLGLTKRELFAAMAMQGLLAASDVAHGAIPSTAVRMADRLLAELAKEA